MFINHNRQKPQPLWKRIHYTTLQTKHCFHDLPMLRLKRELATLRDVEPAKYVPVEQQSPNPKWEYGCGYTSWYHTLPVPDGPGGNEQKTAWRDRYVFDDKTPPVEYSDTFSVPLLVSSTNQPQAQQDKYGIIPHITLTAEMPERGPLEVNERTHCIPWAPPNIPGVIPKETNYVGKVNMWGCCFDPYRDIEWRKKNLDHGYHPPKAIPWPGTKAWGVEDLPKLAPAIHSTWSSSTTLCDATDGLDKLSLCPDIDRSPCDSITNGEDREGQC